MDWVDLKQHYSRKYEFTQRMKIGFSDELHSLIQYSSGLVLDAIEANKSLAIAFPNKLDSALWLALVSALYTIKQESSKEGFNRALEFKPGDHLLLNNRQVVRFVEEYFCEKNKIWMMKTETSDDGIYYVPRDSKLKFQKTLKAKLSPLKKLSLNRSQSKEIVIDNLLRIKTAGNYSLFHQNIILVSSFNRFQDFNSKIRINDQTPSDVFLWGKLSDKKIKHILTNELSVNSPSCLIAKDLYSVLDYLESDSSRTKAIIIDGSKYIERTHDLFLELLDDFNIPIIVLLNSDDRECMRRVVERGLLFWFWNRDYLKDSTLISGQVKNSASFSALSKTLENYYSQKIECIDCSSRELEEILPLVFDINKSASKQDNSAFKDLAQQLWYQIRHLSQLVHTPDTVWYDGFTKTVQSLADTYKTIKVYLGHGIREQLDKLFQLILGFASNALYVVSPKVKRLYSLFSSSSSEKIVLVVSYREQSLINEAKRYWLEKLLTFNIDLEILSFQQFFKNWSCFAESRVILSGWINGENMSKLVYMYNVPEISILSYPLEKSWWLSAQKRWSRETPSNMTAEQFSQLTGIPEQDLDFLKITSIINTDTTTTSNDFGVQDIIDLEQSIKQAKSSNYLSAVSSNQFPLTSVKLVIFDGGSYCFMTESKKYPVISSLGFDQKVEHRQVVAMEIGDFVVFNSSNKDLIRQRADKMIKDEGKLGLREKASLWQIALQECYQALDENFDDLLNHLELYGCNKDKLTVKNWLFNEDMIGFRVDKDKYIEIIAQASGYQPLIENMAEVSQAISDLYGYHQKAGHELKNQIFDSLKRDSFEISGVISTESFGDIFLLEVKNIGELQSVRIAPHHLNSLMKGEDS